MKNGLVIVDAYSELASTVGVDGVSTPKWSDKVMDNVNHFSKYLNYVCEYERSQGTTIIHTFGETSTDKLYKSVFNKSINQIEFNENDVITASDNAHTAIMELKLNKVYWGGFHFGKCIHSHSNRVYQNLLKNGRSDINILNLVLNLSMTLPEHSWMHHISGKKGWGINLDIPSVRDMYRNSSYVGREFLPNHIPSQYDVNFVFAPSEYKHSLWSLNGFENLSLKKDF
tara:strand:+ start:3522 stop:4205 length:684 start_codon:yes stop_codon:yes gene_type:complete